MQVSGQPHAPAALPSQKQILVPIEQKAGYEYFRRKEKPLVPARNLTPYCPACNLITTLTMQSQPQNYDIT
jgi:hypothetical protein